MFEKLKYDVGRNRIIEIVQKNQFNYIICPIRFSIGAIIF